MSDRPVSTTPDLETVRMFQRELDDARAREQAMVDGFVKLLPYVNKAYSIGSAHDQEVIMAAVEAFPPLHHHKDGGRCWQVDCRRARAWAFPISKDDVK